MQVMGGNCGGIIASYVYLIRDAPRFITGHSILIGIEGYGRSPASPLTHSAPLTNSTTDVLQVGHHLDVLHDDLVYKGERAPG